jgi:hypothetical protein
MASPTYARVIEMISRDRVRPVYVLCLHRDTLKALETEVCPLASGRYAFGYRLIVVDDAEAEGLVRVDA